MPSEKIMGEASEGGMPKVRFFERQLASPRILDRIPPQAHSSGWMAFVTLISQSPVLVFRFDWSRHPEAPIDHPPRPTQPRRRTGRVQRSPVWQGVVGPVPSGESAFSFFMHALDTQTPCGPRSATRREAIGSVPSR